MLINALKYFQANDNEKVLNSRTLYFAIMTVFEAIKELQYTQYNTKFLSLNSELHMIINRAA